MEGKSLKSAIVIVVVMCLVLENIQVEAKSCCPSTIARNVYNTCRFGGGSRPACASISGCKHFNGKCKPPYTHLTLYPHSDESEVSVFCTLGCTHSVCDNIAIVFDTQEVNNAAELCKDACLRFCSKDAEAATVVA